MNVDDLHNTEQCPVGHLCEGCGASDRKVAVATATTTVGVLCLTLCGRCAISGITPLMPTGTASVFVGTHCAHLGITVDDMAEVLAGDDR